MHNRPAAAKMQAFFRKTLVLPFLRLLVTLATSVSATDEQTDTIVTI